MACPQRTGVALEDTRTPPRSGQVFGALEPLRPRTVLPCLLLSQVHLIHVGECVLVTLNIPLSFLDRTQSCYLLVLTLPFFADQWMSSLHSRPVPTPEFSQPFLIEFL